MNMLDDFNKLVKPAELGEKLESSTTEIADHLTQLIDAKNKPIVTMNVTYSELKKLFDRLMSASYWTREPEQPTVHLTNLNEQEESVQYTTSNEQQQQQPQNTNELLQHENPLNPVQHVEQVHQQQQQQTLINEDHHQSSHMEQGITSFYVIKFKINIVILKIYSSSISSAKYIRWLCACHTQRCK